MKRALVTGGCGFIGSNLTKELVKQGWQVDIVDDMSNGHLELLEGLKFKTLPNASFIYHFMQQMKGKTKRSKNTVLIVQDDFAAPPLLEYIKTKAYDVIFHQAAVPRVSYSVEHPYETTIANIAKTVALFDAAKDSIKRIVNASSSSVYGGADKLPTKESENKKNPKSPYAWQKSAIEDYSKICWNLYGLDIVNLRYFNVFGPGQYGNSPYSTAISAWCHAIKNGLECRSDGDGEQSRDMCYVDNIVSANILAADAAGTFKGLEYNIACGDRTSNNQILEYLKEKFGEKVKVKHAPARPGDVKHTQADVSYATKDFGYKPLVRFWEGLDRTIEWWGLNSFEDNK
jgi:nucleoside-diphosphate-sugar epimerase